MHSLHQLARAAAEDMGTLPAEAQQAVSAADAARLARELAPPGKDLPSAAAFGARLLSLAHGAVAAYVQWLGEGGRASE